MAPELAETRRRVAFAAVVLVAAVALAWSNSFTAPFVLDDHDAIVGNESLRELASFNWLKPAAARGETIAGRPVLNLSLALNYAAGSLDVRGYHVTNLLIHATSALLLFGVIRRSCVRWFAAPAADGFALSVALLWALHPLQTAAVTYIAQRAESLAGLFYLLTIYGFIRGTGSQEEGTEARSRLWLGLSVGACLFGMATKETMVTVPLIVLLYDRAFVSGSFGAAWRARRLYYVALAGTWLLLLALVWASGGRGESAGFDAAVTPLTYLLTQCEAIVRYLALAFWPAGQVFDYGAYTVAGFGSVWPQALMLAVLMAGAAWALWRNRVVGFLGAAFFLLLAPSSSVVPIATQTIAEHRMYLALAPVILIAVLGVVEGWRRSRARTTPNVWLVAGIVTLFAVALGAATWKRNEVFGSERSLWQDAVAKWPANPRAHYNLGLALARDGDTHAATAAFRATLALQPNHAFAHFQLGTHELLKNQWSNAATHLAAAVAADPGFVDAHINLARAMQELGRPAEAVEHYRLALAAEPDADDVKINLAALLSRAGRANEAETMVRQVLASEPTSADAHYQLGLLREQAGDLRSAEQELRDAVRLRPEFAAAHLALGNLLARTGDASGASEALQAAIRLNPRMAAAHYAWGNLLAKSRRLEEAIASYRTALALEPNHLPARNNLANALLMTRRIDDAIREYEEVLRLDPQNTAVRENLRHVREARAQAR